MNSILNLITLPKLIVYGDYVDILDLAFAIQHMNIILEPEQTPALHETHECVLKI